MSWIIGSILTRVNVAMGTLGLGTVAHDCNPQDSSGWENAIGPMPPSAICQRSGQPLLLCFIEQTHKKVHQTFIPWRLTQTTHNIHASLKSSLKSVAFSYLFLLWSDTFQYDEHNFKPSCMSIIMNSSRLFKIHYTSRYTCTYTSPMFKGLQSIEVLECFQADKEP